MKGYTTREVAEVLGLPTSRIRSRELLDAEVPARRVRQALEGLRDQLPTGRPLSAVNISAVGDRVLVRDSGAVWDPDSGQLQMDFSVSEVASMAEPVARRALRERADSVELEAVAPDRAKEAYGKALELDPAFADAHLNLGRLVHEEGRVAEAEAHYRTAASADPESGRAFYNLGVALEDQGKAAGAIEAYEAAVRLDADLGVAHFNLSRLFEAQGRSTEALNHLAAYKRLLDRGGERA